jgi:hypothetical protein
MSSYMNLEYVYAYRLLYMYSVYANIYAHHYAFDNNNNLPINNTWQPNTITVTVCYRRENIPT